MKSLKWITTPIFFYVFFVTKGGLDFDFTAADVKCHVAALNSLMYGGHKKSPSTLS